ncbi:MAG: hypothetical protein IPP14_11645 [Planctomycetes bacterium]|nr:hypothetical protein [Planctomycetota bacterium]
MNAPTTIARSLRRRITEARADARALAIELWRDGRSVAGILMETSRATGIEQTPKALLAMLARARVRDASIPPALRSNKANPLDTRADLQAARRMAISPASGPWDGDEAEQ